MSIKTLAQFSAYLFITVLLFSNCKIADLRTEEIKTATSTELDALHIKGKKILKDAYLKQGLDKFETHQNYSFVAHEKWHGIVGKIANSWPVNDVEMRFNYRINSFDGRVEILSGKKQGTYFGLQSWKYYEGKGMEPPNFNVKKNDKVVFSITAYHYFAELLVRLQRVPVIEYAGSTQIDGLTYDIVLATWGENSQPTKDYDQYLVFINQKTGLLEYCTYSVHESKLGSKSATASIHYFDYQEIDGVLIPMQQKVTLSRPKKGAKPIHRLKLSSFEFDVVEDSILFPDKTLPKIGDDKPTDL